MFPQLIFSTDGKDHGPLELPLGQVDKCGIGCVVVKVQEDLFGLFLFLLPADKLNKLVVIEVNDKTELVSDSSFACQSLKGMFQACPIVSDSGFVSFVGERCLKPHSPCKVPNGWNHQFWKRATHADSYRTCLIWNPSVGSYERSLLDSFDC